MTARVLVGLSGLLWACAAAPPPLASPGESPAQNPERAAASDPSVAPVPPAPGQGAKPLAPEQEPVFEDLSVPGHRPAIVSAPPGSDRRPLLVAAHGAGDRAEELCAFWQAHIGRRAFVLCLRGVPMNRSPDTGWFYRHHYALGAELVAALDALGSAHPRVDPEGLVYMGYSQGATMGLLFTQEHPARFPRLLLVEGGFDDWNARAARRYAAQSGAGVVLLCGIAHCADRAARARGMLERAGVAVRFEHVRGGGHTYVGAMGERAAAHLRWLVRDDPRWGW